MEMMPPRVELEDAMMTIAYPFNECVFDRTTRPHHSASFGRHDDRLWRFKLKPDVEALELRLMVCYVVSVLGS